MDLKRLLVGTTAAAALFAGSSAQAGDYYVSVFGGISELTPDFSVATGDASANQVVDWNFGKYRHTGMTKTKDFGTEPGTGTPTWVFFPNGQPTGVQDITSKYIGKYFSQTTNQFTEGAWGAGFDTGFVIGAAIGREIAPNWRAELEVAYRNHDVDGSVRLQGELGYGLNQNFGAIEVLGPFQANIDFDAMAQGKYTGTGPGPTAKYHQATTLPIDTRVSVTGEATTWSFMFNIWRDLESIGRVTPFVGVGIGVAQLSFDHSLSWSTSISTYQLESFSESLPLGTKVTKQGTKGTKTTGTNVTGTTKIVFGGEGTRNFSLNYSVNGDEWGLAYQFGVGASYDLGNGMGLSAQYRYFHTQNFDFGPQINISADSHNFMIGFNMALN